MKGKKCPYCGRRISYLTVFHEKKHGVYECTRCKKESKVKVDKKLIISFLVVVLLIVLYIIFWRSSAFYNNFLGIIPPIIILIAFYFCTQFFIRFVPLKRFLDDIERKQEQEITTSDTDTAQGFVFNKKVFDEIKNKRNAPSSVEEKIDRIIEEENYVPVIENVSEAHTSSQATLKRVTKPPIYSESMGVAEDDVKQYVSKKEKPNGTKYTANRKF
ncbi:MAG: hypothetical protein K6F88_06545 [Ruminococcus sp.]|nr:hypothetical protein [Ruminococcus sp.]